MMHERKGRSNHKDAPEFHLSVAWLELNYEFGI